MSALVLLRRQQRRWSPVTSCRRPVSTEVVVTSHKADVQRGQSATNGWLLVLRVGRHEAVVRRTNRLVLGAETTASSATTRMVALTLRRVLVVQIAPRTTVMRTVVVMGLSTSDL